MSAQPEHAPPPGRIVAYEHPELAGVLLCPEHSQEYPGSVPLAPGDLPDGGYCSHGTPDGHVCARAFPMKKRKRTSR